MCRHSSGPGGPRVRILHAVEFYSPSVGGSQVVVQRLSEALAADGHDVTVLTSADAMRLPVNKDMKLGSGRLRVVDFDVHTAPHGHTAGSSARGQLHDFLSDNHFDVAMLYNTEVWTTDLVLPDIQSPVVLTSVGTPRRATRSDYYRNLIDLLKARKSAVATLSAASADHQYWRASGVRVDVIPNAAEVPHDLAGRKAELLEQLGISEPYIVSVGNHTGLKGHEETIQAYLLSRARADHDLVIIGGGALGHGCATKCSVAQALTKRLPGGRIHLVTTSARDTAALVSGAQCSLLLSRMEASPLVLFEAAAVATPFISSDVGNAAEIASWTGAGFVLPTQGQRRRQSLEAVRAARLLNQLLSDPEQGRRMGLDGQVAVAARFTWQALTDRYLAVYKDLAPAA